MKMQPEAQGAVPGDGEGTDALSTMVAPLPLPTCEVVLIDGLLLTMGLTVIDSGLIFMFAPEKMVRDPPLPPPVPPIAEIVKYPCPVTLGVLPTLTVAALVLPVVLTETDPPSPPETVEELY